MSLITFQCNIKGKPSKFGENPIMSELLTKFTKGTTSCASLLVSKRNYETNYFRMATRLDNANRDVIRTEEGKDEPIF